MKKCRKSYRKIGEYGILQKNTLQYKTKLYTAKSEKKLIEYLKEKGIL